MRPPGPSDFLPVFPFGTTRSRSPLKTVPSPLHCQEVPATFLLLLPVTYGGLSVLPNTQLCGFCAFVPCGTHLTDPRQRARAAYQAVLRAPALIDTAERNAASTHRHLAGRDTEWAPSLRLPSPCGGPKGLFYWEIAPNRSPSQ